MAVLGNAGIGSVATTSAASTQPAARAVGIRTGGNGRQPASTWAMASSSGIIALIRLHDAPAAHEFAEELGELGPQVVAVERELHGRTQVIDLLADVEAPVLEHEAVDRFLSQQDGD